MSSVHGCLASIAHAGFLSALSSIDPQVLGHLVHGEAVDKSKSKVRVDGEVPIVVPNLAVEATSPAGCVGSACFVAG